MFLDAIVFFGCAAMLLIAGNAFVNGAVGLGAKFVSPMILGLVVSLGTTLPAFAVLCAGMVQQQPELVVGALVGSCLLNLGGYLAVAMLVRPQSVSREVARQIPLLIVATGLFYFLLSTGSEVSRSEGGILVAVFLVITVGQVARARRESWNNVDAELADLRPAGDEVKHIVSVAVALPLLLAAGYYLVAAAVSIGGALELEAAVVGLTLVATAIVLPDLVVTLVAAMKGHADLGFGNVIASNIISLTAAVGVIACAFPIDASSRRIDAPEYPALIFLTLLLWPLARLRWRFGRVEGAVLLVLYGVIVAALFDMPFLPLTRLVE